MVTSSHAGRHHPQWRRSSYCADNACVEVAVNGDGIDVRDGKLPDSPILRFSRDSWADFIAAVKAGDHVTP
ncbi:DUF397 domain-containing protein [Actinoplanes sp. NPDC051851]|uniref:DUF397 domain-containing protein n=1 Tax=Actinoplanes sp. NPDC051851 TaxID=3154753 RepID=UPI0034405FB6